MIFKRRRQDGGAPDVSVFPAFFAFRAFAVKILSNVRE
jgi:hypothetical protein